jgi:hypothetical protein
MAKLASIFGYTAGMLLNISVRFGISVAYVYLAIRTMQYFGVVI